MSISSVSNQNAYAVSYIAKTSATTSVAKTQGTSSLAQSSLETPNLQADAKSIMSKYDLKNISYRDMATLGKELVASGALPENKLLDFVPIALPKMDASGQLKPQLDASADMISTQQQIIASQKSLGMSTDYSTMVLNMYKNFQSLHDQAFL
jgi:hypothetical protein